MRESLIALPPLIEVVAVVAGLIVSIDAMGESAEAWAPLSWPFYATLGTFPLALGGIAASVLLRDLPARTAAIWIAAVSAAVGVLPFVAALSALLHLPY
ncbi:hypothetical protein FFA01_25900 [Frigoribacterium faeni]|uniref:Uncharacterized protein n=1 Tax=Frigoribacterium faeni TaxID=145483 RepID=A0ABQ0US36_9MICO|nr:hypothetical protein FFA01_25900 [Frigoribacterium faeni]